MRLVSSERFTGRLRRLLTKPLVRIAGSAGYDIIERNYYSPIPDLTDVPLSEWHTPSLLGGITLDLSAQIGMIEGELACFIAEFRPPVDPVPSDPQVFHLANGTYESVDAEILYGMVRYVRPHRIIELGSGRSTQIIAMAAARNANEGRRAAYTVVDPFPSEWIRRTGTYPLDLEILSATQVGLERFSELRSGDLLFVDTTHTVKFASDVNRIVLEILPALAPGVVVHFHDVFLPWPYPRRWLEDCRWFWAEQYLLQAFLAFNVSFEPLLALHALARSNYADRLRAVVPSFALNTRPGAFWLRRALKA